jgi:hypothetical protein
LKRHGIYVIQLTHQGARSVIAAAPLKRPVGLVDSTCLIVPAA